MSFQIFLTNDAYRDLEDLYDYIASHDAPEKADHLLNQIEKAVANLSENPERGLREYREVFFKPYRIIYKILTETVYIMVIANGRRDMQALLQRRLLHPE